MPKYHRNNNFPMRKTRISPLEFWKGERIVYRNNGKDGIWVSIEE